MSGQGFSSSWLETLEILDDRIDGIAQSNEKLTTQVSRLLAERDSHCHTVGQVYHNVTALLTTTQQLTTAQNNLDANVHARVSKELQAYRSQLLEGNAIQMDKLEHQVRRVLENFKDELLCTTQQNAALVRQLHDRVDAFHERMVRMEESQKALRDEQSALGASVRMHLAEKLQQLERDVAKKWEVCEQTTSGLTSRLEKDCIHALEELRGDVDDLVENVEKSRTETANLLQRVARRVQEHGTELEDVKKDVRSAREAVDGRLGSSLQESLTALDRSTQRIQILETSVASAQRELTVLSSRAEDAVAQVSRSTEHFKDLIRGVEANMSSAMHDQLKRTESDFDRRHKKLVDSVHQALAELTKSQDENGVASSTMLTLQQEVQAIRETLHHHSIAIDAQRMEGSLEGAFSELKDWLQDLERRMVSKSQVEDMVANVTAQFHQFKQHTLNAEALLGQRMDAERSARENDLSHQSVQFQKLHSVLKR